MFMGCSRSRRNIWYRACTLRRRMPTVRGSPVLATVFVLALFRVRAQLEVLGALDGLHALRLALAALQLQHDFLGRLGLLVEDGLRLAAEALLLLLVAAVALGLHVFLASLVLRDLVWLVLLALPAVGAH